MIRDGPDLITKWAAVADVTNANAPARPSAVSRVRVALFQLDRWGTEDWVGPSGALPRHDPSPWTSRIHNIPSQTAPREGFEPP